MSSEMVEEVDKDHSEREKSEISSNNRVVRQANISRKCTCMHRDFN